MSEPAALSFPDGPRLELDEALAALLRQAERVRATQSRLRSLLHAIQTIVEERDLEAVLRSVVQASVDLVDAEYGALGVIAPDSNVLEQFIYVGIDAESAKLIGHLPTGHGLLGALISDPRPIRLEAMGDDPRASGFPPNHPPMSTFLGVPLHVRDTIFGNLYLTNRRNGPFTTEDEQLVEALATTAGFAIENARLLHEARTRADWMTTSAGVAASLLSTPTDTSFDLVAGRVMGLAGVDKVTVLVTHDDDEHLIVTSSRGEESASGLGETFALRAVAAGQVMIDGIPRAFPRTEADEHDPTRIDRAGVCGPLVVVPLRTDGHVWGVICIARHPDRPRFSPVELETAADLASQASIALELARAREAQQRALLADDRRRIARDLHDHVIQQLFGTGLSLQALAGSVAGEVERSKIADAVSRMDDAISQIRTVVFALSHGDETSLRHRIIDIVAELSDTLRRAPAIRFSGPVDHSVTDGLADDVAGTVRELLANAVRHAHADRISVEIAIADGSVHVRVDDDGIGDARPAQRRGLSNLAVRAKKRGGGFDYVSGESGTTTHWHAPVSARARHEEPAP